MFNTLSSHFFVLLGSFPVQLRRVQSSTKGGFEDHLWVFPISTYANPQYIYTYINYMHCITMIFSYQQFLLNYIHLHPHIIQILMVNSMF